MVCRAISQSFPEDSESQILINLCIPAGITNGNICDSKWRDKSKTLFSGTKSRTKDRNIHGRNHDEVEWNLCEFRKFIADELKKLRFVYVQTHVMTLILSYRDEYVKECVQIPFK